MADIKINGVTPTGIYVGSTAASAVYLGNVKVWEPVPSMADNTLKFRFSDTSYDPSSLTTLTGATWTQISSEPNVWLWDGSNVQTTDWSRAFYGKWGNNTNQVELIDAGTLTKPITLSSQVGNTYFGLFAKDSYLVSVCPLSFPNATDCARLFHQCKFLAGAVSISCPSATTISDCFGGSNSTSNTAMTSATITTSSSLVVANQVFRGCTALQSFSISTTGSVENFGFMCIGCISLTSVPLFDTSSATILASMFKGCTSLTSVPLYNTSSATRVDGMFNGCTSLTSVPLFNTSSATRVDDMFKGCTHVESGALALYQQMSTQTTPPSSHSGCFTNCGVDTNNGAAELSMIPSSWGGTDVG